jgi:hypothetical protein
MSLTNNLTEYNFNGFITLRWNDKIHRQLGLTKFTLISQIKKKSIHYHLI